MAPLDPVSSGATSGGATSGGAAPGSGSSTPSTPACTPGDEGCGCRSDGSCAEGLLCDAGSCRAVVCGDARVDPGEECDDGNQDDADSCTNACLNRYNVAFVTSTVFTIGSMGGVRGADMACNARAKAAGLPGNFAAYIADSQSSLAARFGAARGWVRPDGKPFRDEIDGPATFFPPNQTELGTTVSDTPVGLGNPGAGDCEDWTSTSAAAGFFSAGDPGGGSGGWDGAASGIACGASFRLYCLQRDFNSILRVTPTPGRRAFVSADPWVPSGGLAGADAVCQSDAQSAGLTGTFRALLATSSASAASRFSTSGTPWVRLDGIPIVTTPTDLAAAQFIAPLQLTSQFVYLINDGGWSGSASPQMAGTLASTCNDWQSSSNGSTGTAGRVQFSSFATAFAFDSSVTCDAPFTHLYCLEQ
jgi:cysteine-rich repeat protein